MKRSNLEEFTPYFEQVSEQYFYTPDGIGCYWFDTLTELKEALGGFANASIGIVVQIEKLED